MGYIIGLATKAVIGSLANLFGSWQGFLAVTFLSCLGVVLYNVAASLVGDTLTWVMGQVAALEVGDLPNGWVQLTGLGAWLAEQTYLDDQIGIAITAVSMKWVVMKIPFLKW